MFLKNKTLEKILKTKLSLIMIINSLMHTQKTLDGFFSIYRNKLCLEKPTVLQILLGRKMSFFTQNVKFCHIEPNYKPVNNLILFLYAPK